MNERALTTAITKVLCKSSANSDFCPFCENKGCDPKMSETFTREAQSVIKALIDNGVIKKAKLL